MNRRRFLQAAGAAAAVLALGSRGQTLGNIAHFQRLLQVPEAYAFSQSQALKKFIQPLRGIFPLDPNGIPVAVPDGTLGVGGALHYEIDIKQYTDTLHPDLGGPTTLRGYKPRNTLGRPVSQRHLGGIIVATKGTPVQITFTNKLSGPYPIPIDLTLPGADLGPNRAATHLHGGFVPWISDGGPQSWFDPDGGYGASVPMSFYKILNPSIQPGQAEYYYPNDQSARLVYGTTTTRGASHA